MDNYGSDCITHVYGYDCRYYSYCKLNYAAPNKQNPIIITPFSSSSSGLFNLAPWTTTWMLLAIMNNSNGHINCMLFTYGATTFICDHACCYIGYSPHCNFQLGQNPFIFHVYLGGWQSDTLILITSPHTLTYRWTATLSSHDHHHPPTRTFGHAFVQEASWTVHFPI